MRYESLLKDLKKDTPEGHPDSKLLDKAISNIKAVAEWNENIYSGQEAFREISEVDSVRFSFFSLENFSSQQHNFLFAGNVIRKDDISQNCKLYLYHDIVYCLDIDKKQTVANINLEYCALSSLIEDTS